MLPPYADIFAMMLLIRHYALLDAMSFRAMLLSMIFVALLMFDFDYDMMSSQPRYTFRYARGTGGRRATMVVIR